MLKEKTQTFFSSETKIIIELNINTSIKKKIGQTVSPSVAKGNLRSIVQ